MVDVWQKEEKPKKNKRTLLAHLADYDRWFGHTSFVGHEK
jgi:hypothetical protein